MKSCTDRKSWLCSIRTQSGCDPHPPEKCGSPLTPVGLGGLRGRLAGGLGGGLTGGLGGGLTGGLGGRLTGGLGGGLTGGLGGGLYGG